MKPLHLKNYLQLIRNSTGSRLFRHSYFIDDGGKEQDVLAAGDLACAFYVSAILKIFDKITALHATVIGTVADLKKNGWREVAIGDQLREGDVLVWGPELEEGGSTHQHIGFYIGRELAVSNNAKKRCPIRHHYNFHGNRKIIRVFRAD